MCLDRWQTDEMRDQPAVIWEGEDGSTRTYSYSQLMDNVVACVNRLTDLGLKKGDAIGIHLPMLPETVAALLAINRVGCIAVPVFSGYGVDAIASRLNAVGAKALFTCFGTSRRGKAVDMVSVAAQAVANVSSVESIILVGGKGVSDLGPEAFAKEQERLSKEVFGGKVVSPWRVNGDLFDLLDDNPPARTSAEDPLIILYTSGTTGKPKGIAHTHASFPIKAAQDMAFGTDVGRGTRICWYTDIGWMMGPWLIYGALLNGATICLYDGAPDYPTPDRMWEFCARHRVEVLGISPTLVRALAAAEESSGDAANGTRTPSSATNGTRTPSSATNGTRTPSSAMSPQGEQAAAPDHEGPDAVASVADEGVRVPPYERHDLSSLRAFASTGEPWNPAPWWWLFEKVGNSKLPIINYSGGTEISGGILMGNPLLPQKPCSFPAPCPGMDVDILDENGEPVGPNQVGELVIKQPWIGMARGFWQEKERYLETYWSRFKDIWVHGDWAMRDKDGHWFILGRSDDTLKVAGKRVGPAEVESLLVAHPLVTEAAVIGVPDEVKGTAMVAFCVARDEGGGMRDDPTTASSLIPHPSSLEAELRALVAKDMGKPLAPSKIHFVSALPKTRNAKVMRRVIRAAYLGEDPGDLSALENPSAVDEIRGASQ
ncbi:MAG: AMP-binding protein [Pyrinomonadaceae bacterium]